MYAQLSYKQYVGSSKLTVSEIGCFVTADANTLEKIGIQVDPISLNKFYTDHKIYTYDLTDKANDDLTWGSITKRVPQLVIKQIGYSGWPDNDLAIVEFRYKNHLGQEVTHFCAVNHAADHSIIDSWDGKVKAPAEYEHVYGQPIAWATFVFHTPETTPAGIHNAPVSAPAAHTPTLQVVPQAPKRLYLPPSVSTWHIYKPEGPYTLPYALKNTLNPKMFGGLTYDIVGSPAPHIYLIQTKNFGRVAIYAGPDTVAQFPGTGHGEGESTNIPVSEVVPAPVSEPSIVYARFEQPMQLVTKEGAKSYNFVTNMAIQNFQPGTPFTAVGKATVTLPNGDLLIYFMDDNDFSVADETQRTQITVGVKTGDLSPAAKPESAQPAYNIITPPGTITVDLHDATSSSAEPPAPINSVHSWKGTFEPIIKGDSKENPQSVMYVTKGNMEVYDFVTGNDRKPVKKNLPIPIVGTFMFANRLYYLAESSFKKGTWYGFPVASLRRQNAKDAPFNTNDDINRLEGEITQELSTAKHAAIKTASTHGFFSRFRRQRSSS